MPAKYKTILNSSLITLMSALTGTAQADWGVNFPEPAAGVAQDIYDIHMLTMGVSTLLLVIVVSLFGSIGNVDSQNVNRRATSECFAFEDWAMPLEMLVPRLDPWIEQPGIKA